MFNIGISISPTKTAFGPLLFSGDLDKGLENISTLGFNGVELSLLNSLDLEQLEIIKKLKKFKLDVYAIATGQTYYTDGYSLYSNEEHKREITIKRIKSHIDFASRLNCAVIIGGIRGKLKEGNKKKSEQEKKGKSALEESIRYAERKKILLLLEPINRFETNLINTLKEGKQLIDEMESDYLKLLPDTFHMNIEESSMEKSIIDVKSYIGYIHFADSNRLAPGFGHTDFKKILLVLKNIDYEGPIGVEILPKPDDLKAAKQAIEHLKRLEEKL